MTTTVDTSGSYNILVLATTDAAATKVKWSSDGTTHTGHDNTTGMDGIAATADMPVSDGTDAKYAVENYSVARPTGASAWFIPSYAQWVAIRAYMGTNDLGGAISVSDGNFWWSSSECYLENDYYRAWVYGISNGSMLTGGHDFTPQNVRGVFAY